MSKSEKLVILVAEDDPDDFDMIVEVFEENKITNPLFRVPDGVELMAYLRKEGDYEDSSKFPRPGIILLDLNMPKLDGKEALELIKTDPNLKRIPVVVFTSSKLSEDIISSYDLGANSFISKPVNIMDFIRIIRTFSDYWLEIVNVPTNGDTV